MMKKEHEDYEVERILHGDSGSHVSLVEMVSSKLQKPVKGEGFGILFPEEENDNVSKLHFNRLSYNNSR